MSWEAWAVPIVTGLLLSIFARALPGLIEAAIDGKFSQFRNEEVARMATHNDNEYAHPRLRVLSDFEERMEKAFDEFRQGLRDLGKQIEDLKKELNKPKSTEPRRRK
jgi:hypothetical protein